MKKLLVCMLALAFMSPLAMASNKKCAKLAAKTALDRAGDPGQNRFAVYKNTFMGKAELEDVLDGTRSKFYSVYFVTLAADNDVQGWLVTTKKTRRGCRLVSSTLLGTQ